MIIPATIKKRPAKVDKRMLSPTALLIQNSAINGDKKIILLTFAVSDELFSAFNQITKVRLISKIPMYNEPSNPPGLGSDSLFWVKR